MESTKGTDFAISEYLLKLGYIQYSTIPPFGIVIYFTIYYMLKKYQDILLINLDALTYAGNLENLKGVEGAPLRPASGSPLA